MLVDLAGDPLGYFLALGIGRLGFLFLRWHLAVLKASEDVFPEFGVLARNEIGIDGVEADVAFLRSAIVAIDAEALNEGSDR